MLTFKALLAGDHSDRKERKALIAGKVEDMLNTVVRQIAFYTFERKVHEARRQGELTPEQLGAIWLEVQAESLGPAIELKTRLRGVLDLHARTSSTRRSTSTPMRSATAS